MAGLNNVPDPRTGLLAIVRAGLYTICVPRAVVLGADCEPSSGIAIRPFAHTAMRGSIRAGSWNSAAVAPSVCESHADPVVADVPDFPDHSVGAGTCAS
jgi:hypothetical protein